MNKTAAIAAFIIATGIILGAFGAHALKDVFVGRQEEIWKTAVFYQLVNALGVLYMSGRQELKICSLLLISGIFIFSGSLYLLVLSGQGWLGAVTPVGGTLMILGWILAGVKLCKER